MAAIVTVEELVVRYGGGAGRKRALDGISFAIEEGETFALLGPNGAGKTTTVKVLTTLLLPSAGRATVCGLDVAGDVAQLRANINFTFGGERGLYHRLTAFQNLRLFADLYHVENRVALRRIDELLALVGLQEVADKRVETFSKGMKQRLHIARTLINDPLVVFLDEPTLGLDPVGVRDLRALIGSLHQRGVTVILTTHDMPDAEALCDRVAFIRGGRIARIGSPATIKRELRLSHGVSATLRRPLTEAEQQAIEALAGAERLRRTGDVYHVHFAEAEAGGPIITLLSAAGIVSLTQHTPSLEDAYVQLTGD